MASSGGARGPYIGRRRGGPNVAAVTRPPLAGAFGKPRGGGGDIHELRRGPERAQAQTGRLGRARAGRGRGHGRDSDPTRLVVAWGGRVWRGREFQEVQGGTKRAQARLGRFGRARLTRCHGDSAGQGVGMEIATQPRRDEAGQQRGNDRTVTGSLLDMKRRKRGEETDEYSAATSRVRCLADLTCGHRVNAVIPRALVDQTMSTRSVNHRKRPRRKETATVALELIAASRFCLKQEGV
jgi:hypothetical protein